MMKIVLIALLACIVSCSSPERPPPVDPLLEIKPTQVPTPLVQDWIDYAHFFRSIDSKKRQIELKLIEKQISENGIAETEQRRTLFKYVIASTLVEASLPQLIRAKGVLNDLLKGTDELVQAERNFWELYADNLNNSIRFQKLYSLVTRKYEEERIVRIELEEKIKALSSIEQDADDRAFEERK